MEGELCAANFQVTTVGHGEWIDVAHSTAEANFAFLFSPYRAAESVPDRKQLMVTSGLVTQCSLMFSSPCTVQIFT